MNANAHSSSQAQAEQKILDKVIRELIAEGRDKGFVTLDEINAQIMRIHAKSMPNQGNRSQINGNIKN